MFASFFDKCNRMPIFHFKRNLIGPMPFALGVTEDAIKVVLHINLPVGLTDEINSSESLRHSLCSLTRRSSLNKINDVC